MNMDAYLVLLMVCCLTGGAFAGTGNCRGVDQGNGNYAFECDFANERDGVISRDDVLWLTATGSTGQRVEIKLPRYLFSQAITGALKGSTITGENKINIRLPAPQVEVTAQKQEEGVNIVSKPSVTFEYGNAPPPTSVHYSEEKGNYKTSSDKIRPPGGAFNDPYN